MIAEILKDAFIDLIKDIWSIGAPYLTIFAALLFVAFVRKIFDENEKKQKRTRREDAQIRLTEARARLAEIQLAKLEAQEKAHQDESAQTEVDALENEEQETESEIEAANDDYYQAANDDDYDTGEPEWFGTHYDEFESKW